MEPQLANEYAQSRTVQNPPSGPRSTGASAPSGPPEPSVGLPCIRKAAGLTKAPCSLRKLLLCANPQGRGGHTCAGPGRVLTGSVDLRTPDVVSKPSFGYRGPRLLVPGGCPGLPQTSSSYTYVVSSCLCRCLSPKHISLGCRHCFGFHTLPMIS